MASSSAISQADADMFGNDEEDAQQQQQQQPLLQNSPPPPPLPSGWFLKESHSHPSYFYYFNQDTGECVWELPAVGYDGGLAGSSGQEETVSQESLNATAAAAAAAVKSILKRSIAPVIDSTALAAAEEDEEEEATPRKKSKTHSSHESKHDKKHHHRKTSDSASDSPKEVRVLHILKKHTGSRRPASWRCPKITISKSKAIEELNELLAILKETEGSAGELRATFEELAKTESDCTSAKRGGDLGFFGRSES